MTTELKTVVLKNGEKMEAAYANAIWYRLNDAFKYHHFLIEELWRWSEGDYLPFRFIINLLKNYNLADDNGVSKEVKDVLESSVVIEDKGLFLDHPKMD